MTFEISSKVLKPFVFWFIPPTPSWTSASQTRIPQSYKDVMQDETLIPGEGSSDVYMEVQI